LGIKCSQPGNELFPPWEYLVSYWKKSRRGFALKPEG